jgi:ketosteroid isomerase-like protein
LFIQKLIKNMKTLLLSTIIAASLFACKSETKPAFDLVNAKKEIESANKKIADFIAKGDSVAMADAYSKDGKFMGNNMPSIAGKDKLLSFWGGFFKLGVGSLTLTTLEVWGDENFITEEGLFEVTLKDGKQADKGKYIVIWKKEDGSWKLHRDMSNTDLPAAK